MSDEIDRLLDDDEFSPPVDEPVEPLAQEELEKLDESVAIPASLMAGDEELPPEPPDPDWGTPWAGLKGEEREQKIRDHYGYTPSEKRTQLERALAAERMVANTSKADWIGPLPDDIKAIWANTPQDEKMARGLLGAWGLDKFRGSALHRQALLEPERLAVKRKLQQAFVEAKAKK